jgi:hypothetical protein
MLKTVARFFAFAAGRRRSSCPSSRLSFELMPPIALYVLRYPAGGRDALQYSGNDQVCEHFRKIVP